MEQQIVAWWSRRLLLPCLLLLLLSRNATGQWQQQQQPLSWVAEPQSQFVQVRMPLCLDCQTNASDNINVVTLWRRNNTLINDFNNKHFILLSNGSLCFSTFLSLDRGSYQCSVWYQVGTSLKGQINSHIAWIDVGHIHDKFILAPHSQSVALGETLNLQCISPNSVPSASVQWIKDGTLLQGKPNASMWLSDPSAQSSSLQVNNFSVIDAGRYSCQATNELAPNIKIRSKEALVSITAKLKRPYFVVKPSGTVATHLLSASLSCVVVGEPTPTITWYHNGVQMTNYTSARHMDSHGNLIFNPVLLPHNGTYHCKGTNSIGSIISHPDVPFVVAYTEFQFKLSPHGRILHASQSAAFDCTPPSSYPPHLKVIWYHDYRRITLGNRFMIAPNGSLLLLSAQRGDSGVYFCSALNPLTKEARTSKKAMLTVLVRPFINVDLHNISLLLGRSINITCSASGSPLPQIRWLKDGLIIRNGSQLELTNATSATSAWYSCLALNHAGEERKHIYVHVYVKPGIVTPPTNQTAILGQDVLLSCMVIGNPAPSVRWYFLDSQHSMARSVVIDGSKYIWRGFKLAVHNITLDDEGWFICNVNSSTGAASARAYLSVHAPPVFIKAMQSIHTNKSSHATFICSVAGQPDPILSWLYFNGKINAALANSSKHVIAGQRLTVSNLEEDDAGLYICKASNDAGFANTSALLTVQVLPSLPILYINTTTLLTNDTLIASCISTGLPRPVIRWLKGDDMVVVDTHHVTQASDVLEIKRVDVNDTGIYCCIAQNVLGTSTSRQQPVVVQDFPHSPIGLNATVLSSSTVKLTWQLGFDGNSQLTGHTILVYEINTLSASYQVVLGNDSASPIKQAFVVLGLRPSTTYTFCVYAISAIGRSKQSAMVDAKTKTQVPTSPMYVAASAVNSTTVLLSWQHPVDLPNVVVVYEVTIVVNGSSHLQNLEYAARDVCAMSCSLLVTALKPFTQYYFVTKAAVRESNGLIWSNTSDPVFAATLETAPSVAPEVISIKAISSTAISIQLAKLQPGDSNGVIRGYTVHITRANSSGALNSSYSITAFTLLNLKPFTLYHLRFSAFTSAGHGPLGSNHLAWTHAQAPSVVRSLRLIHDETLDKIIVSWQPPKYIHGNLQGYLVQFNASTRPSGVVNATVDAKTESIAFDDATPGATYSVRVVAVNQAGRGDVAPIAYLRTVISGSSSVSGPAVFPSSTVILVSTQSSVSVTVIANGETSLAWFNKENLPLILGAVGALFLLFALVIVVLLVKLCRKRENRRERWIVKRTEKSSDTSEQFQTSYIDVRSGLSETLTPESTRRDTPDLKETSDSTPVKTPEDVAWDYGRKSDCAVFDCNGDYAVNGKSPFVKLKTILPPDLDGAEAAYDAIPCQGVGDERPTVDDGIEQSLGSDGSSMVSSLGPTPPPRIAGRWQHFANNTDVVHAQQEDPLWPEINYGEDIVWA